MKSAIAYARFSSDNQDQNSIAMQLDAIAEYAKKYGHEIIRIYKDEGESGTADDRKNFIKMFNDLKSGAIKAEVVLIYKHSRFIRDVHLGNIYESRLEDMGVRLISVTEPTPENQPLAQLQKTIIRAIDEFTSDNIGILCLDGTKQIVKAGYWSGGPPPVGYDRKKIPNKEVHQRKGEIVERGTLVPNAMANIVKRAFEIAVETGKGGSLIYKQLVVETGQPVLGPKGKPLGGGGINAILRNPIYKGTFIYNNYGYKIVMNDLGVNGGVAKQKRYAKPKEQWIIQQNEDWRIVSDELWEAAQHAREANQREGFGHGCKRASYLLTGLIVCGVCGNACGGHWQKSKNEKFSPDSKYYYYRCRDAMNGADECSNKAKIRGKELEAAIIEKLLSDLIDEKFIGEIAREIIEIRKQAAAKSIDRAALESRHREIGEEQRRLIELAAKVGDNIAALADRIAAYERERAQIEAQLTNAAKPMDIESANELKPKIRRKLERVREIFSTPMDIDDLRCVLKQWIEAIRIDGDGEVAVKWKAAAVYEVLEIPPVSEMKSEGSRQLDFGYSLAALSAWHRLPLSRKLPSLASGAVIGFSGVSEAATAFPASAPQISGFSGCIGFSGSAA